MYKNKYIKYKIKYLKLKEQYGGGLTSGVPGNLDIPQIDNEEKYKQFLTKYNEYLQLYNKYFVPNEFSFSHIFKKIKSEYIKKSFSTSEKLIQYTQEKYPEIIEKMNDIVKKKIETIEKIPNTEGLKIPFLVYYEFTKIIINNKLSNYPTEKKNFLLFYNLYNSRSNKKFFDAYESESDEKEKIKNLCDDVMMNIIKIDKLNDNSEKDSIFDLSVNFFVNLSENSTDILECALYYASKELKENNDFILKIIESINKKNPGKIIKSLNLILEILDDSKFKEDSYFMYKVVQINNDLIEYILEKSKTMINNQDFVNNLIMSDKFDLIKFLYEYDGHAIFYKSFKTNNNNVLMSLFKFLESYKKEDIDYNKIISTIEPSLLNNKDVLISLFKFLESYNKKDSYDKKDIDYKKIISTIKPSSLDDDVCNIILNNYDLTKVIYEYKTHMMFYDLFNTDDEDILMKLFEFLHSYMQTEKTYQFDYKIIFKKINPAFLKDFNFIKKFLNNNNTFMSGNLEFVDHIDIKIKENKEIISLIFKKYFLNNPEPKDKETGEQIFQYNHRLIKKYYNNYIKSNNCIQCDYHCNPKTSDYYKNCCCWYDKLKQPELNDKIEEYLENYNSSYTDGTYKNRRKFT